MSRDSSGLFLSAVFVDYDNIYMSLKKKNEAAAKQFSKDPLKWVRSIESGRLITPLNGRRVTAERRLVMSRCYGNPVPRRNQADNSTDMTSFPFVRHHFLRGGFEIVDCPPLTAQLKNSADIRMVMDIRDLITHDTHFDEFVILSSDADFTPLLHRLRAHARNVVFFSNDHTAAPYQALCDGEIRESDLIDLLLEDLEIEGEAAPVKLEPQLDLDAVRSEIIADVTRAVLNASAPQPLEALAERAIRAIGHAKTIGTEWGGAGSFRDLLSQDLPKTVNLTEQAPFFAYDVSRAIARNDPSRLAPPPKAATAVVPEPTMMPVESQPTAPASLMPEPEELAPERATTLQQSIELIHQASKAPPLSPPEYRAIFTLLANELTTNKMQGHQTIDNVRSLALELGIEIKKEDIRFIIDIVGQQDPWFEQGASVLVFASRFRNYVISRCQDAGMQLSADEIDLIDAWFAGGQVGEPKPQPRVEPAQPQTAGVNSTYGATGTAADRALDAIRAPLGERTARWWQETTTPRDDTLAVTSDNDGLDEFPRIVRNRLKA